MVTGFLLRLLAVLAALSALAGAPASASMAGAKGFPPGAACHVGAGPSEEYAALARTPERWICGPHDWSIVASRTYLRFDFGPGGAAGSAEPERLVADLTRFSSIRFTVIGSDGRSVSRRVGEADMTAGTDGWTMSTALPRLGEPVRIVVVAIDGARHPRLLATARLLDAAAGHVQFGFELAIAALAGLLCMPLVFNIAFYRVLRERFLLWHTVAVVMMLVQTLVTAGLINVVWPLSIEVLSWASAISFGGGIGAAALFSADLIEEGAITALHRRMLRATALWIPFWVLVYMEAGGPLRPWVWLAYYLQFVPVLVLFAWIMVVARSGGSRAVKFQIAAWAPFMALGVFRIASGVGLTARPIEAEAAQHVAIAWEVIVTAIGVTDRFMTIRRDRDRAQAEARVMGSLADHDPLTGLFNRRGIEKRFAALQAEGFRSMAVIDIDHFKAVNDLHGHATGDEVLKAMAAVLAPDDDTLAARIGGEEFLVLLRGADAGARAERLRQAIPVRVAAMLPGLDRLITASMGLVIEQGEQVLTPGFTALYSHCDKLLYQAKNCGRNRTMAERRQLFGGSQGSRAGTEPAAAIRPRSRVKRR